MSGIGADSAQGATAHARAIRVHNSDADAKADPRRDRSPSCPWHRARFGTERSRVRIPPSRPLTQGFTEPAAVESAAGQPEIRPN